LRQAPKSTFPDQTNFANLHLNGQLSSPESAASQILTYLARPNFGEHAVADVRDAPTLPVR
jgi:hypothetical protein